MREDINFKGADIVVSFCGSHFVNVKVMETQKCLCLFWIWSCWSTYVRIMWRTTRTKVELLIFVESIAIIKGITRFEFFYSLSDEGPSLDTFDFLFHILAVHQICTRILTSLTFIKHKICSLIYWFTLENIAIFIY